MQQQSRHVPASLYLVVILRLVIQEIKFIGHNKYADQRVSIIFTMLWNSYRSRKYLDDYTQEARKTVCSFSCDVPITVARYNEDWNVPTNSITVRNIKFNKKNPRLAVLDLLHVERQP